MAELADRRDQATDLRVGIFAEAGEHFHLPREQLLLVVAEAVPVLDVLRLGREHGVLRNDAERLLPRKRLFAQLVPALIELAPVLLDPFLRHVMRRMGRARREINEERLVGRERLFRANPGDRVVRHVRHQMVVWIVRRLDRRHVFIERRMPLVRFAADEPIKFVEAGSGRPAVGRPGDAELPGRRLVALSKGGCRIAIEPQHFGQGSDRVRALSGIAGIGGRDLGDAAHVVHVVVAAGEQRDPRRRAKRGRVELVVAQAVVGERLDRRHVDRPAECARLAEAHVVDEDDQHIRRALRRLNLEARRRLGVARVEFGVDRNRRLGDREDRAVECVTLRERRGNAQENCAERKTGHRNIGHHALILLFNPQDLVPTRSPNSSACDPDFVLTIAESPRNRRSRRPMNAGTVFSLPAIGNRRTSMWRRLVTG